MRARPSGRGGGPVSRAGELWRRFTEAMNPPVFIGSALCVVSFVAFGALFTAQARQVFEAVQHFIVTYFGWLYVLGATAMLVFVLWLAFSRVGAIRLGGPEADPEFGNLSWFSMMMAAGMGIGVVFFGAAEPIQHYLDPPTGTGETRAAVRDGALVR